MRIGFCASSLVCLGMLSAAPAQQDAVRRLASAPLRFEPAAGGVPGRFIARGLRFQFSFSPDGAILHAAEKTVHMTFEGARKDATLEGASTLRSTTNILRGNDPANWRTSIPNYGRLRVNGLYPGVDLVYYGNGSELEYDLVVKPASDPGQLRLRFTGSPHIDRHGNLVAGFVQKHPTAYQIANGTRVPVASRYRKNSDGTFGFALGHYDKTRDVIIDPVLTLSAYFAGSQQEYGSAIGHDAMGYIYVAGTTQSNDLADLGTPPQGALSGTSDIFIAKLDPHVPAENQLTFLTYLGGSGDETLNDMVVTPGGFVYLTGLTSSSDFPTVNAYQSAISGSSDAFVMWLDLSQFQTTINYSTFLGGTGNDLGSGIAVDSKGRMFVAGTTRSSDFPVNGGFQSVNGSTQTAFAAAFDPSLSGSSTLTYSTYIGGAGGESGRGVAVAPDGTMWVVGSTYSPDFPVAGLAYQPLYKPGGDGFVAQINPALTGNTSLLYASYLGGSGPDEAKKVIADPAGRIIVAGYTGSTDLPTTTDAVQAIYGGNFDAFAMILNPQNASSQLVYSTYYGGKQADIPYDLKLDSAGNLYLTGFTTSPDFPVSGNALQSKYDPQTLDGFVLRFNPARPSLGAVGYSSYVSSPGRQITYGVDFDVNGNIYLTGYTTGRIFDALGGVGKTTDSGNTDAFLMGINTCSFTLSPGSQTFSAQGGSATISVTPSTPDCTWTVSTDASWIALSRTSGTGAGSVTITVQANTTGASRTATITIGGAAFVVNQQP